MSTMHVDESEEKDVCMREDLGLCTPPSAMISPRSPAMLDSRRSSVATLASRYRSTKRSSRSTLHSMTSRPDSSSIHQLDDGDHHNNIHEDQKQNSHQNQNHHYDGKEVGRYHTHKYLLYFTDPAMEQRYFNFQYVDCPFIPGKMFFVAWTLATATSFVIFTEPITDSAYTASTFSDVWWMGGYISTAINIVLGIGLFIDRLKQYREIMHMASIVIGWPPIVLILLHLKHPDTYTYCIIYGVFMFTAVLAQCRLYRSVLLITVWPLVCMLVSTFAIEEFWQTHSKIEMMYWVYCCSPAVLLSFLEKLTRQSFVEREEAMASIKEIEHKTAVTQRMIANFFPATPTRDLLQQLNGPRDKAYVDTVTIVTDIAGFTAFTARSRPAAVITMLTEMFRSFDITASRYGVEKIATVGDSYCGAVFPIPTTTKDARCTDAIQFSCGALNFAGPTLELRIGVHIGDVVGVFVGRAPPKFDLFGPGIEHTRTLEESGKPSFVHLSTDVLTAMELTADCLPEWPQTEHGILCKCWDDDHHHLLGMLTISPPPDLDDEFIVEIPINEELKDEEEELHDAVPLDSDKIIGALCVFAGISYQHNDEGNHFTPTDDDVETTTASEEAAHDDEFSKFFLTFNSASLEILFQQHITKQGVNTFFAKLFTLLAALLFTVQVLVQCNTNQDKGATAALVAIVVIVNVYAQLVGTNHRFHGAVTFVAYHTMFFISFLALTSECDDLPNQPRYIGNVASLYLCHAVFAPQYCLNVKLVYRCIMTSASAFLLVIGIAIRRNTVRDEVAKVDALPLIIFPFVIMSYFPDYSLRSAFSSGLKLRRLQKQAKSRGSEMTTSALSIMLPTFVTEKIVALAKESNRLRSGRRGEVVPDDDARTDHMSISSTTQDATGDIDFNNVAATWEYPHAILMFAKFHSPDTQSFTPTVINSTVQDVEGVLQEFNAMKVKTIGSTIMIVAGIDDARTREHQLSGIIDAATKIKSTVFQQMNLPNLEYRIGIHCGPCFGAIIGGNGAIFDLFGDTVNTASRMMSTARNGAIHMSAAAHALLPPELANVVEARPPLLMKGKGKMAVFEVKDNRGGEVGEQYPSDTPPTTTITIR